MSANNGGPAFPFAQVSETTGQPINGCFAPGMTLLDWFAGQALAGIKASEIFRSCPEERLKDVDAWRMELMQMDSSYCYDLASAMLAEKAKRGKQ